MTIYDEEMIAYIGVELSNEAREVVVFEVVREEVSSKFRRTPNNEGGVIFTPRNDVICGWIINKLVCFGEEWSWD